MDLKSTLANPEISLWATDNPSISREKKTTRLLGAVLEMMLIARADFP